MEACNDYDADEGGHMGRIRYWGRERWFSYVHIQGQRLEVVGESVRSLVAKP